MNTSTNRQPTTEEKAALANFAKKHGRYWKRKLSQQCWVNGHYDCDDDVASLQSVRNALGPSWLAQYILTVA